MAVINKFSSEMAHYMARTFLPSVVTIKFDKNVSYDNNLFSFYLQSNKSNVNCRFIDFSNSYLHQTKNKYIKTPEQFMKGLIDFNMTNAYNTKCEISNGESIAKFKSNYVPHRYLLMLQDFCPNIKVDIEPVSVNEFNEYENKLRTKIISFELSDKFCGKLLQESKFYASYSQFKTIEVVKAPEYSDEDYKNLKNNYLYEQFKERYWKSGDGTLTTSPSTQIFISKSHNYKSLVDPNINKQKFGYELLHSASGGIDFRYMKYLPLYQLLNSFSLDSLYHDLVGHDNYRNSSEIDLTELTIFEEILKKEKAEIIVE